MPCQLQCSDLKMPDTLHSHLSIVPPTLQAAVAEAAFMTGMERNSPTVRMASYAPLFVNTHNRAWGPDAIVFNTRKAYGIPSYYVQQMFAENMGTAYVSSTLKITFGDVHSIFTAASTTCLDSACRQVAIKVGVLGPITLSAAGAAVRQLAIDVHVHCFPGCLDCQQLAFGQALKLAVPWGGLLSSLLAIVQRHHRHTVMPQM